MNKLRVIDVLNKIANGEEVPKEIKYNNMAYYWCNQCKIYERLEDSSKDLYNDLDNLNDEVEIIEEDKKIEPIEWNIDDDNCQIYFNGAMNYVSRAELELALKINEIIEELNRRE